MAPLRLFTAPLLCTSLPSSFSSVSILHSSLPQFSVWLPTKFLSSSLPMDNKTVNVSPGTEASYKEACDSGASKRFADRIIPHILRLLMVVLYAKPLAKSSNISDHLDMVDVSTSNLPCFVAGYGSSATSHDFEIYAPDASFEDPLMCAHGVKQIKSAFYSLPKVFSESKIVEYNVEENMVSPGKGEILIDNKQHYKFLGKDIDLVSLIKLYVEDGRIIRHEDWWDKKPISNRETVKMPLLGRVAEMTRRGSMLVTHVLMGFGKDPTV